jgi:hypothetical protein
MRELHLPLVVGPVVFTAGAWRYTNILIGAKRRIAGLRLRATDSRWANGDGPEVSGPLVSLILAMAGRKAALSDLGGEGLALLADRS